MQGWLLRHRRMIVLIAYGFHRFSVCSEQTAWRTFLDEFSRHYCDFRAAAVALSHLDALLALGQVRQSVDFGLRCDPSSVHVP